MRAVMATTPEGYRAGKQVHASSHSTLHEATREADGCEVLLKVYLADRPTDDLARVRREFDLVRRVAGPGIPRALDLDCSTERAVLVLERVAGLSLARHLRSGPLDVNSWLHVACEASEILARIHAARILHKDITPSNLLFDTSPLRVWICDFGLAAELGAAQHASDPLGSTLAGTLQYISPEQTGRMNRGCDFRSDLYSLGATLYHALTGRPPFESDDALELVHAHLARVPPAPATLRPDVPQVLSRMLLKLLRKEPQERYQSARALHADLLACRAQLASGAIPADFALGSGEALESPRFAPRLYGRESELARLRTVYTEVVQGSARTLWLEGPSGVGKSTLVEQLRPLLVQTHGYLVIGKFDLYGDRPYAGWIAALSSLVQQLLIESDARLERWRSELASAVGPIAHALVDLVPDLTFILGDVPPAARLEPREAQARLSLALQRFIAACATTEHPLVVFLDDLQSSDVASRTLLEELLASPPPALLLIGAYREPSADASFATFLAQLPGVTRPELLELGALPREAATAMLADALALAPADVRDLADLIERRTGNLPVVMRDFVEHVHARGLLRYEAGRGWTWDPAEISSAELPESGVALMSEKLDRLAPEPRAVLDLASCVGDQFDIDLLCELSRRERGAISEALYCVADAGLIIPCADGFRFAHDRIRECAQEQLSADERARIHCETARLLLERIPDPERSPRAVEIVEHLNRVPELPADLRASALRLNGVVGNLSLSVGAAAAAAANFAVARRLLADGTEVPAQLALEIHLQSAESAFQLGEFDAALALLDAVDERDLARLELSRLEGKRIQILAMCREAEVCVRHTLGVLARFGVRWPLHPSRLRAQLEIWVVRLMLRIRGHPERLRAATSVKPENLAPLIVIRPSAAVLARVDVHLAILATCLSMREQTRFGYLVPPGFALAVYATYLYLFLEDGKRARQLAEAALGWAERIPDPSTPRTRMMVEVILYPFLMPRRQALSGIERIVESARESGDLEFAHYARFNQACYLALAGDPVREVSDRFARMAELVRGSLQWAAEIERCRRAYVHLERRELTPAAFEESYTREMEQQDGTMAGQGLSGTVWLLVLCAFGRHDLLFAHSERLSERVFKVSPFVHVVDHTFYRGVAAAVLAGSARGRERRRYRQVLRHSLRYLKRRAADGPDFVHMAALLRAERARLERQPARARALYEEAAQAAGRQGFLQHAALAHERHASLLGALRRDTEAAACLRKAIAGYREWGAHGKAQLLAAQHSELLPNGRGA